MIRLGDLEIPSLREGNELFLRVCKSKNVEMWRCQEKSGQKRESSLMHVSVINEWC